MSAELVTSIAWLGNVRYATSIGGGLYGRLSGDERAASRVIGW